MLTVGLELGMGIAILQTFALRVPEDHSLLGTRTLATGLGESPNGED